MQSGKEKFTTDYMDNPDLRGRMHLNVIIKQSVTKQLQTKISILINL